MSEILSSLSWRYATKKFNPEKKISPENIDIIKKALQLTASGFGMQPWKFVLVENPQTRQELLPHSYNQAQVIEASHLLVLCARTDLEALPQETIESTSKDTGAPLEALEGYKNMMAGSLESMGDAAQIWADKQVYIALGNILTVLADLKIDSCAMEGFNPQKYDEILHLSQENCHSVLVLPMGYRDESDEYAQRNKTRFSQETLFITQ